MYHLTGSCHCGTIEITIGLPKPPADYRPRACDCSFCTKHGAAYVSDPAGRLGIVVNERGQAHEYSQGSGSARMLLCRKCGVQMAGLYRDGPRLFAAINVRMIDGAATFGDSQAASPRKLSPAEKVARWKSLWFADVTFEVAG